VKGEPPLTDKPVGIDFHVQEMMRKLGVAHSERPASEVRGEDIRVVGMYNVPVIGTTTLTKIFFHQMRYLFNAFRFLLGIGSEGVQFSRVC